MTRSELKLLTSPIRRAAKSLLDVVPAREALSTLDRSWKLKTKKFPYSCTDEEGMVLFNTILSNGLCSGFEISTAFGYSAAYIASALKMNGGHLTSLDCYIEEAEESYAYDWADNWDALRAKTQDVRKKISQGHLPNGLALAQTLAREINSAANVSFCVGISPHDIPEFLTKEVDFVLIDGGHFGEQPTLDYKAVEPFLASKCAIFFHDNNTDTSVERAIAVCASHLGSAPIVLPTRYNLTLVGRGLDPVFLAGLKMFCLRSNERRQRLFRALAKLGIHFAF